MELFSRGTVAPRIWAAEKIEWLEIDDGLTQYFEAIP
jgi:hypothetical protein